MLIATDNHQYLNLSSQLLTKRQSSNSFQSFTFTSSYFFTPLSFSLLYLALFLFPSLSLVYSLIYILLSLVVQLFVDSKSSHLCPFITVTYLLSTFRYCHKSFCDYNYCKRLTKCKPLVLHSNRFTVSLLRSKRKSRTGGFQDLSWRKNSTKRKPHQYQSSTVPTIANGTSGCVSSSAQKTSWRSAKRPLDKMPLLPQSTGGPNQALKQSPQSLHELIDVYF
ncbi:hypothetical protein O181_028856 [Austropuccinia psidii MF-1]|uniref:Uncharacterized protein n=1 Tax=Austropuccinia psidii MF-1 TaxID=1389203 RepID=A0A9Q3CVD3_9BASI|nr:hypothetical protein [Austropuccinia psidii MF-1]